MNFTRRIRRLVLAVLLYLTFTSIAGIYVADGALHPARRLLTPNDVAEVRRSASSANVQISDIAMTAPDGAVLRGWILKPQNSNGDAVILLHGLGDNRLGMLGYANLFLANGFTVLLPDARAHGSSGGQLSTYGLLERNDVHQWLDLLDGKVHPHCMFGLGESMGAAQLLQSLDTHPKLCAVAAESAFANFREIAYDRMGQPFHTGPWLGRTLLRPIVEIAFLRARWKYGLHMWEVSPERSIANSDIPILLIHGEVDSNIPVRHSRLIHAHHPETVLWEVPDADHCGAFAMAPKEFEQRLLHLFSEPKHGTADAAALPARIPRL